MDFRMEKTEESSLRAFLKSRITMKQYFGLLKDILEQAGDSRKRGLQVQLQPDMIRVVNGKVQLNTFEEDSVIQMDAIIAFIKQITFQTVFASSENCQEITDFLQYMDDKTSCQRVEDIYEYCLDQVYDPEEDIKEESDEKQSGVVKNETAVRTDSREQIWKPSENGETGTLDPRFWEQMKKPSENGETGVLDPRFWDNMKHSSDQGETGVLDPNFWKSVDRSAKLNRTVAERNYRATASLVQLRGGVVTNIDSDSFWIGKENVDLILDKPTISRKHAVITRNDNHFFISDNGSTNKTYVDNQEIPPKASVEIFQGTKIRFAKEEYEFRINQ